MTTRTDGGISDRLRQLLASVRQDTTYAVRSLRRQTRFAFVALALLGVTMGLNTSLFTVFVGMAYRPWAGVADASAVVRVRATIPNGSALIGIPLPEYRHLAANASSFEGVIAMRSTSARLGVEEVGRSTPAYLVSGNFFDVLGIPIVSGRGFAADEDRSESPRAVVVLGEDLWRSRFGGDPSVVGQRIQLNEVEFTVVGVSSRDFVSQDGTAALWIPLSANPLLRPDDPEAGAFLDNPNNCCVEVVGRLATGIGRGQAAAEATLLGENFRASIGEPPREAPFVVGGTEYLSTLRRGAERFLIGMGILGTALTMVLLIACANVGNLLLARAVTRRHEVGVRISLGATRPRIVRQLLTEGFVLALGASALGILLTYWLPPVVLHRLAGSSLPFETAPDLIVLGYGIGLAAIACVAIALAPALHATSGDLTGALKGGARGLTSRSSMRGVLLAIQVTVSVVLLISAGLLLRGLERAWSLDPGFSTDDVMVANLELPMAVSSDAARAAFVSELTSAIEASPLETFAFAAYAPFGEVSHNISLRLPGEVDGAARSVESLQVTSGYFDVLRIPILAGRNFDASDAARPVALINETMARRYWPDGDALGSSFFGGGSDPVEIIGIVRDAHTRNFTGVEPLVFQPFNDGLPTVLYREESPSAAGILPSIVTRIDSRARVQVVPLREYVDRHLRDLLMGPLAALILGSFALLLATVGIFGVFSYEVRQQTREFGIRLALGAKGADVTRLVLKRNSLPLLAGLALGIAGAIAGSRLLRGFLYGISAIDPLAYAGAALLLCGAGLMASYLPARRAQRIDPAVILKAE